MQYGFNCESKISNYFYNNKNKENLKVTTSSCLFQPFFIVKKD